MSSLAAQLGITLGTTPSTGTTTPSTPSTPSPATVMPVGVTMKAWNLTAGETVYRTNRDCTGPVAWSPWLVACVFGDGQAVLVGIGNEIASTRKMRPGYDIRRSAAQELYPWDPYPGP